MVGLCAQDARSRQGPRGRTGRDGRQGLGGGRIRNGCLFVGAEAFLGTMKMWKQLVVTFVQHVCVLKTTELCTPHGLSD